MAEIFNAVRTQVGQAELAHHLKMLRVFTQKDGWFDQLERAKDWPEEQSND